MSIQVLIYSFPLIFHLYKDFKRAESIRRIENSNNLVKIQKGERAITPSANADTTFKDSALFIQCNIEIT